MEIKNCLSPEEFQNFTTSSGQLDKWTLSYGVQKRKVNDEAGKEPEYMVSARMETLLELTKNYEPENL